MKETYDGYLARPQLFLEGAKPRLLDEWQTYPILWDLVKDEADIVNRPGLFILTGSYSPKPGTTAHTGSMRIRYLDMRSFFISFPQELLEAAKIDGAGEFKTFVKVVLPLSKAILATIALFIAVGVWNNWFTTMLFIQDADLRPLAYALQIIIEKSRNASSESGVGLQLIGESVQYAAIIVSTVPILIVYPFLQKHFTKGVMIGSIKG